MRSKTVHTLSVIMQVFLLITIWWIGSLIQHMLHLPVSAGVTGLLLLLLALMSGCFKLNWIKTGSDFLLGELVLFFIPCIVGLIKYKELLIAQGWQLVLCVVAGTLAVMVCTAYAVHLGFKIESLIKNRKQLRPSSHAIHGGK